MSKKDKPGIMTDASTIHHDISCMAERIDTLATNKKLLENIKNQLNEIEDKDGLTKELNEIVWDIMDIEINIRIFKNQILEGREIIYDSEMR